MPRLAFFVGKGGVGKTTIASAYAVKTAASKAGTRVLLVSTDPAHSLGDVLEKKLGSSPKHIPITGHGKLWAWELNASSLFRKFLDQYKQNILEIVDRGSLFTAEEISPLLDTALPGMAEMVALLAIREATQSNEYSHIVVDTAPFGHTLRLFGLSEQFSRLLKFLELAAGRDRILAEHFAGASSSGEPSLILDWREKIAQITEAFASSDLFLVTTAEKFALNESVRCLKELKAFGARLKLKSVVVNRAVTRSARCLICQNRAKATRAAQSFLRKQFASAELYVAEDPGFPILGPDSLSRFAEHVFARKPFRFKPKFPPGDRKHKPMLSRAQWPELTSRISFVLGKGGVGKTTISAGLGFHERENSKSPIDICSVDPAPSLDDIFQTSVGDSPKPVLNDQQLRASELDSVALFRKWIAEIKEEVDSATTSEQSGVHIDLTFERQLLSALLDIVPPGLDEVLAIFRISDLHALSPGNIIIDMAPTGHALELLRMPEQIVSWSRLLLKSLAAHRKLALARNAAVRIAELELRARELSNALRSPKEAVIFPVMLAEPLPDRETERLFSELDRLGLKPQALFVNRIIDAGNGTNCGRCRIAAQWQASLLARIQKRSLTANIFVVRNFPEEIAGTKRLRAFTREIWRLN